MELKENRDRYGELRGYWDEKGTSQLLSVIYEKDEYGNVTDILRDDITIIPMSEDELEEIRTRVAQMEAAEASTQYQRDRAKEYPPIADYLDGVVKGDQEQIDTYIAACQAVKNKYPKPE